MKNQTKKVYLILIILLMGYVSLPVSMGASGTITIETFDTYAEGVQNGVNTYVTFEHLDGDYGITTTDVYKSPPNSVRWSYGQGTNNDFNLTLHEPTTINKFEFSFYYEGYNNVVYDEHEIYVQNETLDTVIRIQVDIDSDTHDFQIYDYDGWYSMGTLGGRDNEWLTFGFQCNHSEGNPLNYIYYYAKNETGSIIHQVEKRWIGLTELEEIELSKLRFKQDQDGFGYADRDFYIDDINISSQDFGSESTYGNVNQYDSLCEGGKGSYIAGLKAQYLENRFDIPVSLTIKAVDLYVGNEQYNRVSTSTSNYHLEVNNIPCGSPTYFYNDGIGYTLRWYDITITLNNEKPIFEFKSDSKDSYNEYWYPSVNMEGGSFRYHNTASLYGNGVYDGGNSWSFGLGMCFYYESLIQGQLNYDDNINSVPSGIDTYHEYDSITFQYTVSSYYNTFIQLWYDSNADDTPDTQYTGQGYGGYGYNVKTYAGTCSFVPYHNHDGEWSIHIVRVGSNVSTYNFTVENLTLDTDYNGQVWVTPNMVQMNQDFTIGWLYNKTYFDNYNGIVLFTDQANLDGELYIIKDGIKTDNQGGMNYNIHWNGIYYVWLCVNEGNEKYVPVDNTIIYVGINTFTNYITTDKNHYELEFTSSSSIAKAIVTIGYSHMFLGGDVYIMIDNSSYTPYYVGDNPQNELEFDFIYAGIYNVKLIYYLQDGSYEILDNKTITVGDTNVAPDNEETQVGVTVKDFLHQTFDGQSLFFIGIAIILVATLIPLFISYSLTNEVNGYTKMFNMTKEIDSVIYIMFAICGFIIDIFLELFDLYTIVIMFFVIGGVIAIYIGKVVSGTNGQS